jgi:hypothetical protein
MQLEGSGKGCTKSAIIIRASSLCSGREIAAAGSLAMKYRDGSSRLSIRHANDASQMPRERFDDPGPQSRLHLLRFARHARPIIAHRQRPVRGFRLVIDRDFAGAIFGEGVLEGVDDKLGDDEAKAYRHVR